MTREELYEIFEDIEQHRIYCKEQFADRIAALPLDVPGDDEIDAIVYAACKDAYDPDGCVTEAYKLGIKIAINEIIKRNTPWSAYP